MGCFCSKQARVEENDAVSLAERGGGYGDSGRCSDDYLQGKKIGGEGHGSEELEWVIHRKTGIGATKVPEKASLLGRAKTYGLDKAIEVLDNLGSSMPNLTPKSGFLSGVASRGNKVDILSFEVANTIAKGAKLMQSLSEENIHFIKKEILSSEGVQQLVSRDIKQLLTIAATDKSEELHIFSVEVVRFGDMCKDPQWHNLGRYFDKSDSDPTPRDELNEEADTTMQQLISLAQHTCELYHELHALDRLEQDFKRRLQEEQSLPASRRGESIIALHTELKQQRKIIKSLKKESLWSKSMEEVVEKLVEIVVFLHKQILEAFDLTGSDFFATPPIHNPKSLGISGLALHYANVINQIDNIVSRPIALPPNTRDTLYRGLPIGVKAALRSRLLSFHVDEELTVSLIKTEMQKVLRWLFPMAVATMKAQQGFGWVGEWADMGSEVNRKPGETNSMFRIQTLYHADKEKTELYILQLVVWLHHLMDQAKNKERGFNTFKTTNHPPQKFFLSSPETSHIGHGKTAIADRSADDIPIVERISFRGLALVRSKSCDFPCLKEKVAQRTCGISRSAGNSPAMVFSRKHDFQSQRRNLLDVIDTVDTLDLII